jgi:4-aminobutyrate aminotransferase-like enzyme
VALKILEVIERERLADNARVIGALLKDRLQEMAVRHDGLIRSVRGLGMMIGIELQPDIGALANGDQPASLQFANRLHQAGLLTIPSGTHVIRLLPALNLRQSEAEEGLKIIEQTLGALYK